MHGDLSLGGPVWLFATIVILLAVSLAVFVIADALLPRRRALIAEHTAEGARAPRLWAYAGGEALFLAALALAQVVPGISVLSGIPVAAAPFALALGVSYLLRVVFPR